jgi:hypothetical protein
MPKKQVGGSVASVLKKLNALARETKIVSKSLRAFGHKNWADKAHQYGYGRKKQKGGSFVEKVKKLHAYVKKKKLISKGLKLFGHDKYANYADMAGYGKKKRVVRKRQRGGNDDHLPVWLRPGGWQHKDYATHPKSQQEPDDIMPVSSGPRKSRITRAKEFVKKGRLVSGGLKKLGFKKLSESAHQAGWGKKRTIRRQRGGDFLGIGKWVKGAANTVYKKVIRPTYDKVLKPAGNYIKDHPVSAIGTALSFVPGPVGLAGKAIGVAGRLSGKGRKKQAGGSIFTAIRRTISGKGRKKQMGGSRTMFLPRGISDNPTIFPYPGMGRFRQYGGARKNVYKPVPGYGVLDM